MVDLERKKKAECGSSAVEKGGKVGKWMECGVEKN
jgi:hypothetical protein